MNQQLECFRAFSEFLVQVHEQGCIYYTTDLNKYDFVQNYHIDLPGVGTGEPLVKGGSIEMCIKEKRPVVGNVPRNVYGVRMKTWVWPIEEEGKVIGTYGVAIPKLHPVVQAFEHFAEPLANAFPEGAFIAVTGLETVLCRQGSKRFDIDESQVGSALVKGGAAEQCIKEARPVINNFDASVYGVPTRSISIPLFDPEDKDLVGAFNLILPQILAGNLQQLAAKLSANVQEIASGPVIIIFALFVGAVTVVKDFGNFTDIAQYNDALALSKSSPNWILSAVLYLSLCFFTASTYYTALGKSATNKKEAKLGAILGAVVFVLALAIMNTAIMLNAKETSNLAIPTLYLARKISYVLGGIFSIILVLGMFSSCSTMMWSVCSRFYAENVWRNRMFAVAIGIVTFILGQFSFSKLVSIFYPFIGYVGSIFIGCIVWKGIKNIFPPTLSPGDL